MAISFVGQASAAGASVALPAHVAGDLILIFAYQDAANLTPALPAGYTVAPGQISASNSQGHRLGYKVATGSSETSGTWTDANGLIAHVYRGVDSANPVGGSATATNIAAVTYPAITMAIADGTSWVAAFAGTRVATQPIETPPTGMANRSDAATPLPGEVAGHDTNGGVSSFAATTGGGTGFRYRTASLELRAGAGSAIVTSGGSATGGATVSGAGIGNAATAGTITAAASASATGFSAARGAGSGTGAAQVQGDGAAKAASPGQASGAGQAGGAGASTASAAGAAAGYGSATGSASEAVSSSSGGVAVGAGIASGAARSASSAGAASAGVAIVAGSGRTLAEATGEAAGRGSATGSARDASQQVAPPRPVDVFRVPSRDTTHRVVARSLRTRAWEGRTMAQHWWKYPEERRRWYVDWSDDLSGEDITAVSVQISPETGATLADSSNDEKTVVLLIEGGVSRERGTINIAITTSGGQILKTVAQLGII